MSEERKHIKEKLWAFNKKQKILVIGILLLFFIVAGYFLALRPKIVTDTIGPGIYIKNTGDIDALIWRVDGFWYWGGQVAMLANIPEIKQLVEPGARSARLKIPDIPVPDEKLIQKNACYMKLILRYGIPNIPVFRFKTLLYFEYNPHRKTWEPRESIPVKFKSLGNLSVGNIGQLELTF